MSTIESKLDKLIRELNTAIECRIRCDVTPDLDNEFDSHLKKFCTGVYWYSSYEVKIDHPYEHQTQLYMFFLKKLKELKS